MHATVSAAEIRCDNCLTPLPPQVGENAVLARIRAAQSGWLTVSPTQNQRTKRKSPPSWWAESISRGDMEETVLSINPYLINASVLCRSNNACLAPDCQPTPLRRQRATHRLSIRCGQATFSASFPISGWREPLRCWTSRDV